MTISPALERRLAAVICGLWIFGTALSAEAPTAASLYQRAVAEEAAVRAAASPSDSDLRHAIAAYELVVRRFPKSGYCDNALWQASGVALLSFRQTNKDADRATAERLLKWLSSEYPSSPFVRQVDERLQAFAAPGSLPAGSSRGSDTPAESRAAGGTTAVLSAISREALPGGDRIVLQMDHEVPFATDRIANPDRVYVDLSGTAAADDLSAQVAALKGMLVTGVRLGHPSAGTTRVVVDLAGAPRHSIYPLYDPYRLVIDAEGPIPAPLVKSVIQEPALQSAALSGPSAAPALSPAPAPAAPSPAPPIALPPAPPTPPASSATTATTPIATTPVPQIAPAPISRTLVPPGKSTAGAEIISLAPPSTTRNGDYSLARQLGLSVQRIVIDAGHGGHDPGAQGNGLVEKDLVLDVALRLKKLLEAQPGVNVMLTRDTDEFIPLEERTAIANRAGADLFLSIHANASRRKDARGLETYFLNFATNPEAEAVAARENAAASQSMGQLPEILKAIALNAKLAESRELATMVQTSMVRRLKAQSSAVRDLGVKQAPFVVLIGAQMPSVLAEISFVTNRADASMLKQNATKQRIAQALFDGILKYQNSLKKITTVASKGSER